MGAISDLWEEVQQYGGMTSSQFDKMMHPVPDAPVVNREKFILERANGKRILDIGCTGPMGEALREVALEHHGIDILPGVFDENYHQLDLDKAVNLPYIPGLELIIAAEVIEHLSNAGNFLDLLKTADRPVILTTPNAFGSVGEYYIKRGIEHVNKEHTCWYSWYTLNNLVTRHGFEVKEWYWYRGKPMTAEGMIFVME